MRNGKKNNQINIQKKNKNADNSCTFTDFNPQRPEYISTIIITDNQENFNPNIKNNKANNVYEIVNFYKLSDKNLQRKLEKALKRVDNEGGQVLIDTDNSEVGDLSNLEIDSIFIITDNQENFNPNIKNNKANNVKEQDMKLLDELKALITKVENDKGENMNKTNTIENEKVDKRKLIDEVGGILKDKVDEEVWRTVIGKLEKLSYDKSEAGTADNAEDEKKPCGNEKEEKDEGEEEKKTEEKKEADNKCNNSVENSKPDFFAKLNEVYNSALEPPKEAVYISQADRLEAANEYFGASK